MSGLARRVLRNQLRLERVNDRRAKRGKLEHGEGLRRVPLWNYYARFVERDGEYPGPPRKRATDGLVVGASRSHR